MNTFYRLGQKPKNNFVRFLVQMRTREFAFEINWPLKGFAILPQTCCYLCIAKIICIKFGVKLHNFLGILPSNLVQWNWYLWILVCRYSCNTSCALRKTFKSFKKHTILDQTYLIKVVFPPTLPLLLTSAGVLLWN